MLPVLIVAFKRPEKLRECIARLAQVKPCRLYVSVDGPRTERERIKLQEVYEVIESVTWDCEIIRRYADSNHGCRDWVSSSISWFFEQEEFGIILEEDVLVDARFFEWCVKMRDIRRARPEIMQLNAFDPTDTANVSQVARLTRYVTSWGWASWRDAWSCYDDSMQTFLGIDLLERYRFIKRVLCGSWRVTVYYFFIFILTSQGKNSSWAYRWALSVWSKNGFAAAPGLNLSENVGTGEGAVHASAATFLDTIHIDSSGRSPVTDLASRDPISDEAIFHIVNSSSYLRLSRVAISLLVPRKIFFAIRRLLR